MKILNAIVIILVCCGCGRRGSAPTLGEPGALAIPNAMLDPQAAAPIEWNYCYTIPWDGPTKRHFRIVLNDAVVFDRAIVHSDEAIHPIFSFEDTPLRHGDYTLSVEDLTTTQRQSVVFNPTNTVQIEIYVDPLKVVTSGLKMMHL
jgi:hypothetical protein